MSSAAAAPKKAARPTPAAQTSPSPAGFSANGCTGAASRIHPAARRRCSGDVSITVDTSQDRTTFLDAVYAGGYALDGANADVSGGARVTFTGSGANLTFDGNLYGTGRSSGGNASAVVAGISTLAFTDYTGDFNAAVRNFDAIEFSGGTSVTLTKREADAAVNSYTFNLSGRNSSELSTAMVSRLSGSWNFTGASAARIIDLGDGALFTGSGSLLLVDATPELLNFADDGGFTLRYGADSDTLVRRGGELDRVPGPRMETRHRQRAALAALAAGGHRSPAGRGGLPVRKRRTETQRRFPRRSSGIRRQLIMDDRFSYEPPKLESYIGSGIAFGTEGDSGPYNPGGDGDDGGGGGGEPA